MQCIATQTTSEQEIQDFIDMFSLKFKGSIFCEIGYRKIRGGQWTIEIFGYHGNYQFDNKKLNFFPVFDDEIQASLAVIKFCQVHWQFKNKQHMDGYDYLPLNIGG